MRQKKAGFTMVEIVISTLVFALAIAGLLSAISSLNRPAVESFEEVQAAYIGKQILEELKQDIDAELWDITDDSVYNLVENRTYALTSVTRNNISYSGNYTVTADDSGGRWVDITISWD